MALPLAELKQAARDLLSGIVSNMLLGRIDSAIEEGAADAASLINACIRTEKMVNLFVSKDLALALTARFNEILRKHDIRTS